MNIEKIQTDDLGTEKYKKNDARIISERWQSNLGSLAELAVHDDSLSSTGNLDGLMCSIRSRSDSEPCVLFNSLLIITEAQFQVEDAEKRAQAISFAKSDHHAMTYAAGNIGAYSKGERLQRIRRYLEKKKHRVWTRSVKYGCRKDLADKRTREKGRFVSNDKRKRDDEDEEVIGDTRLRRNSVTS